MNGLRMSPEQYEALQKKSRALDQRIAATGSAAAAPVKKANSTSRLQALGRLKKNEMNKTEAAYAAHLNMRVHAGDVLWYRFEAIKLILASNTSLTVDFFVMLSSGALVAIDVKGAKAIVTDDARVKMKVAADMFPFQFFFAYPRKAADGGGFELEEVR